MFIKGKSVKNESGEDFFTPSIEKYTCHFHFPINKEQLLKKLIKKNIPKDIKMIISLFPEKEYESSIEIATEERRLRNLLLTEKLLMHGPVAI